MVVVAAIAGVGSFYVRGELSRTLIAIFLALDAANDLQNDATYRRVITSREVPLAKKDQALEERLAADPLDVTLPGRLHGWPAPMTPT